MNDPYRHLYDREVPLSSVHVERRTLLDGYYLSTLHGNLKVICQVGGVTLMSSPTMSVTLWSADAAELGRLCENWNRDWMKLLVSWTHGTPIPNAPSRKCVCLPGKTEALAVSDEELEALIKKHPREFTAELTHGLKFRADRVNGSLGQVKFSYLDTPAILAAVRR